MRKILLCLVGCLGLPCVTSAGYPPVSVDIPIKQVAEHSYYALGAPGMATDNEGFISNAGFVITSEGVVVFDSLGSPSLGWRLREAIRELSDQPVVKVIVSHYHADHIYGLQVFADEGAKIIAPRGVYDYLASAEARQRLEERRLSLDPWVNDETRLVSPDMVVEDLYEFSLGGIDFRVDYLGSAHSDGDMTLYVANDRVLFSGDIIFEGRVPFVGDADTRRWLAALDAMQTEGLVALVPGHGPSIGSINTLPLPGPLSNPAHHTRNKPRFRPNRHPTYISDLRL